MESIIAIAQSRLICRVSVSVGGIRGGPRELLGKRAVRVERRRVGRWVLVRRVLDMWEDASL